ncbi:unnamed protein product [Effrenium voratum]|nr:unnamed protein product [Effrenium voratum]
MPGIPPWEERPVDGSPVCASMMFPNAEAPSARGASEREAKFQLSLNSIRSAALQQPESEDHRDPRHYRQETDYMGAMPQCRKRHAKARLGERTLMVALVGQTKERRSAGLGIQYWYFSPFLCCARPAVRVCYVNCETDPRCSVVAASAHDEELAVLGRKDAPYGVVQRLHSHFHERCAVVKHKGQPLMRIEVNDVGSLDLLVVTPAGKQLAQGGSTDGTSWYLQDPGRGGVSQTKPKVDVRRMVFLLFGNSPQQGCQFPAERQMAQKREDAARRLVFSSWFP